MVVDLPSLALFLAPLLLLLGPHQVHRRVQQHLGQGGDRAILKHMKRTSIQGTSCANISQMSTIFTYAVFGRLSDTLQQFSIKKNITLFHRPDEQRCENKEGCEVDGDD